MKWLHVDLFSMQNRTVQSLRRKFAELYRKRATTGSSQINPQVLKAKNIKQQMIQRAEIGGFDECAESVPGFSDTINLENWGSSTAEPINGALTRSVRKPGHKTLSNPIVSRIFQH